LKLLRLGNVGQEIPAAIDKNGKYRNLLPHIKDFTPETINFENLEKLKKINLENLEEIDQNNRIGSCITKPGNFFAIGLNYVEHAKETKAEPPMNPILFNKSVHCIVGPNDNVVIPKDSKKLDHEVEIALIIGKKAKRVKEKNAQDYIFGYCICNDISERDWQKEKGGQWVKGKSGDTFGPLGPYLVTKDDIEDIENMNLSLDVNKTRHQTGNTNQMIFNFNFLVAHITSFITLMPGYIVTTGTPPGVGLGMNPPVFLKDGDRMKLSVDSLGIQNIKVVVE
jgi:2-keto-4-pentenoate hydratase/2-oxohepta-3-ene-1,7-dioic acid hydratase in catechol pathway